MRVSFKLGTIIIFLALFSWGGVLGLFYFSPNDLNNFPDVAGMVKGRSVKRWRLTEDQILITYHQGQGDYAADTLFITEDSLGDKRSLDIVRDDSQIVFSQLVSREFTAAGWDKANNYFIVTSSDKQKGLRLIPADDIYKLVPAD